MKNPLLVSLLTLAAMTTAAAQTVEQEIVKLENQIADAVVKSDAAFVERVWGDDFFYTGVRGEIRNKKDILAELKAGDLKFELLKFDDIKVRQYGEAAVATGLATTKGKSSAGEITGRVRYTRVYVKRNGAWQLVLFQGTPVGLSPPPPAP